jgi:DNA-binding NtrC family response regulator
MENLLVVDDDPGFRSLLETILAGEGYQVATAATAAEALRALDQRQFQLVVSDLRLPDGSGVNVLRRVKDISPATPVIMITAFGTVATAVEAMKLGALDYLGKPLSSPDELRMVVRRALDQAATERERQFLREQDAGRFACRAMVAEDARMLHALELVRKVAPTNATVLILGESGTGKELVARCIHNNSARAQRVFVPVNCAALSPTLIESELFGHEKGAFTGAAGQHAGRFERAHGGTLFLDEIGELDLPLQAKLLRVLQDRTFERVGGTRQISVDVRIIAATNRDLRQRVAAGQFREDLFYRLSAFPVALPPLRERPADILRLARHFLGRTRVRLTAAAEQALTAYSWPGNVRELENMMERVAILCEGEVTAADLPFPHETGPKPVAMRDIERQAIEAALRAHQGNRTHAAKQLGISLRTLQYRLKEYGLS